MSLISLPHAWTGKDQFGRYREITVFSEKRNAEGLNHRQIECPNCGGLGGLRERRKADRRAHKAG